MLFPVYELNIAGSEWFIIIIVIVIFIFPTKIASFSRSIGKILGEYEKARTKITSQKDMIISNPSTNSPRHNYVGPNIQRPISSEREKLELIAKSLSIDYYDNLPDDDLRMLISAKLKEPQDHTSE
jgi:sec-independent protein translocase protein TatA